VKLRENTSAAEIARPFEKISRACTDCHKQFRDVPLAEKAR